MPNYNYKCSACGHTDHDKYVKDMDDYNKQPCPACDTDKPMGIDWLVTKAPALGGMVNGSSGGVEEVPVEDFDMEGTEKAIWKGMHADANHKEEE